MHTVEGEIWSVSKQHRENVVVAKRGSGMTSCLMFLVTVINTRIGSQENVDNLSLAAFGSVDERWRLKLSRQTRVDINRTMRNQRLDN
jgi:hypothetical protein